MYVGTPANNSITRAMVTALEKNENNMIRFGEYVKKAEFKKRDNENNFSQNKWSITSVNRGTSEESITEVDVLVLSDKLLVQPNTYSILSKEEVEKNDNFLKLPDNSQLGSTSVVVLLIAIKIENDNTVLRNLRNLSIMNDLESTSSGVLKFAVHDSAKPGRRQLTETLEESLYDLWVVHSTAAFAQQHMEGELLVPNQESVLADMRSEFLKIINKKSEINNFSTLKESDVVYSSVFGWDHAQPDAKLEDTHRLDENRMIGLCGDYFASKSTNEVSNLEAAVLSGEALANALAIKLK